MPIDSNFIFAAYDGYLDKIKEIWEADRTANINYPLAVSEYVLFIFKFEESIILFSIMQPILIEIPHGPVGIIINIAIEPFGHVVRSETCKELSLRMLGIIINTL